MDIQKNRLIAAAALGLGAVALMAGACGDDSANSSTDNTSTTQVGTPVTTGPGVNSPVDGGSNNPTANTAQPSGG